MNPDRWRQVADLYEAVLDRDPTARETFLAEACREDTDLRREVESLLAHTHTPLVVDHEMLTVAETLLEGVSRLEPGSDLGPYRVEALVGAGSMGDVYRARDTKLNRHVALKVLPESFTRDPDRLARFVREAHVLASLNHPNIAAIHGLEERGDVHALVLEFVEGPTLAERIARNPIALPEALAIARELADALAVAHEHGVIHRDLKPANIKVRDDGTAKVLDFGLAKPTQETRSTQSGSGLAAAQSPAGMSPVVTAAGVILGTAAYMSPEQARGRPADKRSDMWAFGCVLYEMLTGKRAFDGDDVSETLASVLKSQPDWTALPNDTPAAIRRLLRRSLQKDPRQRLSDMADARLEIEDAQGPAAVDGAREIQLREPSQLRRVLPWALAAALATVLVTTFLVWKPWRAAPAPVAQYLTVDLGADASLSGSVTGMRSLAISPDGSMLAFVGERDRIAQLYLRRFNQLNAVPLATGQSGDPFFSPDGQWVGFVSIADGKLKKVAVAGGKAVPLCDIDVLSPRGASWGDDHSIVFNPYSETWRPLFRVAAAGGMPQPATTLSEGEVSHRWPQVLPGANAILFAAFSTQGGVDASNIVVQRLPSGPSTIVLRGAHYARYVRGYLIYAQGATLFAVPFDAKRLEVTGQPVAMVQGVMGFKTSGASLFDISETGTLAYVPGELVGTEASMLWMRPDGTTTVMRAVPRDWRSPQFSPDGERIAFHLDDGRQLDIYTYEWARDFTTRLTFDPSVDSFPVWSPDGRAIVFSSTPSAKQLANLYWVSADGSGERHRLTESHDRQIASSWHPSGKFLAFDQQISRQQWDLMILPMEVSSAGWKAGTPTRVLSHVSQNPSGVFSPDGRWLAYMSNESGHSEVFVRPFDRDGVPRQVSTSGGRNPTWSRRRDELFYLSLDSHLMVVSYVVDGTTFRANAPQKWSEQPINERPTTRSFDLHPDGARFVVSGELATAPKVHTVVLVPNFLDEVRARLSNASR